ncbi:MAG: hypothetical protein A2175_00045 [Candidatus Nealsonbacteria bacterium RBG_13_42_11]|uniref:Uncharacterized protein n=1 Tax=Candidatus Nealsonbacteria bacterium RBG_13_42_11 TaxID=1801663 RepID=A0A1G2DYT5_9BACT|nr:MAG: hypothetical protein A2175_00045 [Candidatus Nealsonbacteria bacterium RBG_13_42_11]
MLVRDAQVFLGNQKCFEARKEGNMWKVKFSGTLPPGFHLMEDEDFVYLMFKGDKVAKFSHAANKEEIEKAAEKYLSQ